MDGGERVTGQSRGSLRTLNTGELTYLGGVETEVCISELVEVSNYTACISVQGGPRGKPPVDLVPTVLAAAGPLL